MQRKVKIYRIFTGFILSTFRFTALLLFTIHNFQFPAFAAGLSANYGEVKLTDLLLGCSYSVQPLTVTNTSDDVVTIRIEVIKPQTVQIKPGYEPIPDTSWIKLEKDYFPDIPAGGSIQTNVSVTISSAAEYSAKKYQVYLWSHTEAKGQMAVAVGINSRLLLEISLSSPNVQGLGEEKKMIYFKQLLNKSGFTKDAWNIEKELTNDLKEELTKDFILISSIDKKLKNEIYVIEGKINKFELGSREFSALPLAYYREYFAEVTVELQLKFPPGKTEKIESEKKQSYKKIRTIIPGPTEEELIDDKATDFESREEIKWGSEEFKKSIAGKVIATVVEDLTEQIKTKIIKAEKNFK